MVYWSPFSSCILCRQLRFSFCSGSAITRHLVVAVTLYCHRSQSLLSGVSWALCLLPSLLESWSMVCSPVVLCLSLNHSPYGTLLVPEFGLLQPLLLQYFHVASWGGLSRSCAFWDSLSGFPGLLLGKCILGGSVIGFPLLGVHPSVSIVR